MWPYVLVKYTHLLAIFSIIACLASELVLVKSSMTRKEIGRVSRIDGLYGLSAIIVVAAGLTLWFGVGKGSAFYNNPVLHTKVALFIVVGLLSIKPTLFFIRQRKGSAEELVDIPTNIRSLIKVQLLILAIIPPLGTMVAYGLRF